MTKGMYESIEIDAPAAAVYDVAADVASYPEWAKGVNVVEVLDADADGRVARASFRLSGFTDRPPSLGGCPNAESPPATPAELDTLPCSRYLSAQTYARKRLARRRSNRKWYGAGGGKVRSARRGAGPFPG